jgi:pantoate--beta-alanine ligase
VRTVRTVAELREALRPARREERTIGLVPTMGALHEGHLSLVRHARATCDVVVVSLFVNPAQFNEASDLAAYPRDEERDAALVAEIGADLLFAPPPDEVYPPGFATTVHVSGLTETLEGEHRGVSHFDGVATVVTKLLNMVGPDVAFFGQKDAQQALVIRALVRDLDLPVRIEVRPTVREPDGLALSSRNARLTPAARAAAPVLHRALLMAREAWARGVRGGDELRDLMRDTIAREPLASVDYVSVADADTLDELEIVDRPALLSLAVRFEDVRLIDNEALGDGNQPLVAGVSEAITRG